ncbi:hypothetical protein ACWEPC_14230 [Nonomuraea sp. NPDC004297]
MRAVAAAAGVRAGLVMHYFGSTRPPTARPSRGRGPGSTAWSARPWRRGRAA